MIIPEIPDLTQEELYVLMDLREKCPRQFYSNVNSFYIREMKKYIQRCQVWRNAIMGETRSGKSECAQTICFNYMELFNLYLKEGFVENGIIIDFKKRITSKFDKTSLKNIYVGEIDFNVNYIYASQSDYQYALRNKARNNELRFGQISLIDEERKNMGLGSYTEMIEMENLNNIIAKYCQCEIFINPKRFIEANTPFGIRIFKKDIINKVNWGLLYKIDMTPEGTFVKFLGWLRIPLHKYSNHREDYENKKNEWINSEIKGSVDDRLRLRHEIALTLSQDPYFNKLNDKGVKFVLSKSQQIGFLEDWIINGKCQNFNEAEKVMIIEIAREKVMKNNS